MSTTFLKIARIAATAMLINAGASAAASGDSSDRNQANRFAAARPWNDRTRSHSGARRLRPGAAFGRHTHPGEEIIYVLEGSLEYQVEGKPPVTLKAGDVFFVPAGTVHAARNVGSSPAAELATYVVEKGKPL